MSTKAVEIKGFIEESISPFFSYMAAFPVILAKQESPRCGKISSNEKTSCVFREINYNRI